MPNFNDRDDLGDRGFGQPLRRRFEEEFDQNSLVPLPATQMMRRGAPAGTPSLDQPFRFTQGNTGQGQGGQPFKFTQPQEMGGLPGFDTGFTGPENSQPQQGGNLQLQQLLQAITNLGSQSVPQGPTPVAGGPGPQQQGGNLQSLMDSFRSQFILGQPSSNLADPRVQNQASQAFQQIIAAAGGSPDLRAEIGDARFVNRLQEFIGKGDTLDQSGRINVGNGVVINSLRDLADFNQPGANTGLGAPAGLGGAGGFGGGGFGSLVPGTGAGHPGVPAQFVGGRAAGQSNRALQRLASGGGIDPNLMFEVEKSLRESAERTRTAETEALTEGLASRRITGGGVEAQERGLLSERLAAGINTGLRDFGTSLALQGSQNQLAAAQSLAQNQLGRRGQDISLLQSRMQNVLQQQSINNNFALGQGGLALQNLALNNDFALGMIGARIDLGMFERAVTSAGQGDITQLLQLLLGSAETISRGAVDQRR